MKVTLNAKELSDLIKDAQKAVDQIQFLTVEANKGVVVTTQSTGKVIALRLSEAKVESPGVFTVKPEILTGILKNRKEIILELKDNSVSFKAPSSKGYAGSFVTLPVEKVAVETEQSTIDFSEEFVAALNTVVSAISLNDVHLGKTNPLPIFIRLSDKGTEFSCCDGSHFSYARTKAGKSKKDILMCLPAGTIPLVNALAKNGPYKLAVTDSSVFAANSVFRYRIPLEQFDQAITLDDAKSMLKQLRDVKVSGTILVRVADLKNTMENLMSVYEENVPVEFLVKDGALKARTKTDHGTVSDTLKGREAKDMKAPASVHPVVINDILNRLKGETVRLTVHSDKCLMLETSVENVDYVYSCILL